MVRMCDLARNNPPSICDRQIDRERVTYVLDRLARVAMGDPDFATALAATLDGGSAVLTVVAKDPRRVERVSPAVSRARGKSRSTYKQP